MNSMILHISCPDQQGIVAKFTSLLFKSRANILSLEQHVEPDEKLFFMRIHADLSNMETTKLQLETDLKMLENQLNAQIQIYNYNKKLNVALMVTKESAPLYDLLIQQKSGELKCNIPLIISNHETLKPIADQFDVPFHFIPITPQSKLTQEEKLTELLENNQIDLVVLARYMQILSSIMVEKYSARIINIHHGFLPAFKGKMPYHQAWKRGVKIIGATAHYVTEELDEGPIIDQNVISVNHQHSVSEMIQAGRNIERSVLTQSVKAHIEHRIILHGKRTIIFHS
jgi:formyltetrahydrofolate deformylase